MEISSQGLKYDRTVGLNLSVAVFLTIGTDHISPVEHPTFEVDILYKLRKCVYPIGSKAYKEKMKVGDFQ